MTKNNGFSLIELMVVIAIVAIIAAVATPIYRHYIIRANLSAISKVIDGLMDQSIQYSATHGKFGNAHDLGLAPADTNGGYYVQVDATKKADILGKYNAVGGQARDMAIGDTGFSIAPCGKQGLLYFALDPIKLGIPSDEVDNITPFFVQCYFWNGTDGLIHKQCLYSYGSAAASQTDDGLIPGWKNMHLTSGWDYGNYVMPGYDNAVCQ